MTRPTTQFKRTLRKRYGAWLRGHRQASGLTQRQVANIIGYADERCVSQIERGVSALPSQVVGKLAEHYGVSGNEFAKRHMYFLFPTVYAMMFDADPIELEGLASNRCMNEQNCPS